MVGIAGCSMTTRVDAGHVGIRVKLAGNERGVPRNDDFNGAKQEGVGYYQLFTRQGWRCSTAVAYLKPARGRSKVRCPSPS